jgi:Skp family chaperone for outer membrane proteins
MRCWRCLAGAIAVAAFVVAGGAGTAQETSPSTILTIDQDRLFVESEFGKSVLAGEAAAAQALEAENSRIEADLIAEEQQLTDRRATLSAEDFSALATAFDEKVVRFRAEQDAKVRELTRSREADRQAFFRAVVPILGDLLVERKAVAIFDKSAIILSLTAIDVTDAAIEKVNATLKPDAGGVEVDLLPEASPEATPTESPEPELTPTPSPSP